ncbi:MAG: hypothetical protein ACLQFW_15935 [Xanthobacteraceae bacterium]
MVTEIESSNWLADLAARIQAEHAINGLLWIPSIALWPRGDMLIEAKTQLRHGECERFARTTATEP